MNTADDSWLSPGDGRSSEGVLSSKACWTVRSDPDFTSYKNNAGLYFSY